MGTEGCSGVKRNEIFLPQRAQSPDSYRERRERKEKYIYS